MNFFRATDGQELARVLKIVGSCAVIAVAAAIIILKIPDPNVSARTDSQGSIATVYDTNSQESWLVGTLYQEALNRAGRNAKPNLQPNSTASPLTQVIDEDADLYIGCAGDLLSELNPSQAQEFEQEYKNASAEDINQGVWREKVYKAVVNSLPGDLSAADPSNAIGCQDSTVDLPQNLIPIYNKSLFDRNARLVLNSVSGTITTSQLQELIQEANSGNQSVSNLIIRYLSSNKL